MPQNSDVCNLLLRVLTQGELAGVLRTAELVELSLKQILMRPDEPVDHVYFLESGTVSMISMVEDHGGVEVGMIGSEGLVGLSVVLGAPTSPLEGLVQVPGQAYRLSASRLKSCLAELPGFSRSILRYVDSFYAQVVQTAVCNGRHSVEQRLARWMLITHDRAQSDSFPMTHEFLSMMLGVRRQGVTAAIGALHRIGLVSHTRGRLTVSNRPGLEDIACGCYALGRKRMEWLSSDGK